MTNEDKDKYKNPIVDAFVDRLLANDPTILQALHNPWVKSSYWDWRHEKDSQK